MQNQEDRVAVNLEVSPDQKVIITWDSKIGLESKIRAGNCLGTYEEVNNPNAQKVKIKAPISGKIIFLEPAGQEISPLQICLIEKCKHDIQVGKLCTFCGAHVIESQDDAVISNDFALSHEKSKEFYEDLEIRTLSSDKLFLAIDLDNTLIHAEIIKRNEPSAETIELGFNPEQEDLKISDFSHEKFVIKLRPFLQEFLANISLKYLICVYTKGTRDYAEEILRQVDPKSIYVAKDLLVSKNEMQESNFKSIKKVVHDGSLALILDDSPDVWGSIKNLIYTQPYHFFETTQGKLEITRRTDVFLYMMQGVLEMIHEIFYLFHSKGEKIKVYEIYHALRQNLFAKERIAFFGLFSTQEELEQSQEYRTLQELGAASITLEPTKETTLIFSRYTNKIKSYPLTEAPVVSLWYIYYCQMYCIHLNPQDFDLRQANSVLIALEKSIRKKPAERNAAKDQMEDYLMKNGSNDGGLVAIRDVVIRKLESRNDENEIIGEDEDDNMETITKKVKLDANGECHIREVNNIIESEKDHPIKDLNKDGQDNQEIIDKEVNLVQHYLYAQDKLKPQSPGRDEGCQEDGDHMIEEVDAGEDHQGQAE